MVEKAKQVLSKKILKLPFGDWLVLLFGLLIFCALCLWTITKSSIWFDEAFGAYMIKFNFLDIAYYTSLDVHPPFFYWVLKTWSFLFGYSELALRSMSVFFGCIAIIFGYLLTRKLFNRKAANLSMLFMVLSPMLIRYGQEMRMYTMVTAIAVAATYVMTIALGSKKKLPWVIYGILIALGLWTHYFIIVVWMAHWVWRASVVISRNGRKHFWRNFFAGGWGLAYLVALAIFLPWVPIALKQTFTVQAYGFWIPAVTASTIPSFLTSVLYYLDAGETVSWLALGFLAVIGLLIYLGIKSYKNQNKQQKINYRLIMCIAFVPMVILFILSMPPMRSYFIDRYLITSTLFMAIFIGVTLAYGLEYLPRKVRFLPVLLVAGLMLLGIGNVWRLGNYNKTSYASNNTRDIVSAVYDKSTKGEPIISAGLYIFYEEVFYGNSDHSIYFVNPDTYEAGSLEMLKDNSQHKIMNISTFTKQHNKVWYVGWCGDKCDTFAAPYSSWKALQSVTVNDSVSGKTTYKAIEYQTN